ncbi:condensation domain-containing protein [Streptomyces hirsutus]|uniref:condensation domain-containing protein n=1 Tax=Streptomyces hirsutus TaxID=35620 RepID=UPI0036ADA12F
MTGDMRTDILSVQRFRHPGSVQECRLRLEEWAASRHIELAWNQEVTTWRIVGDFAPQMMAEAIKQTWQRHDALTATYHFGVFGESPGQLLRPDAPPEIRLSDVSSESDSAAAARALVQRHCLERRPLTAAPQMSAQVVRTSETEHLVSIRHPSMMMDHWGFDVFVRDLAVFYTNLTVGAGPRLDDCGRYTDYTDAEYEALRDGSWSDSVDFWLDNYRGESPIPGLPLTGWRGNSGGDRLAGGRTAGAFSPETVQELREAWRHGAARGITPYCFMLAVVLVLLHRLTGERDLGVLVPAANRDQWEYHDTVGLFATILAPRFRDLPDLSFDALCELVRDTLNDALAHQRVSYHDMQRRLTPEHYGRPLPTTTCYFDYWIQDESLPAFGTAQAEPFRVKLPPNEQEGLAFNLYDDRASAVSYSLSYSRRLFDEAGAQALTHDLEELAAAAARSPESAVASLTTLPSLRIPR